MAVYIYTGKLGGGKSLCAVARIRETLEKGLPVATNLDIYLTPMFGKHTKKPRVIRVPDKPSIDDLKLIGEGNSTYDESKNGLLVLDECGTWFNSRNWNDKSRKAVNDWFLHARKLGWDVILIIQNVSILDSQARDAIAEHTAFCRRLDRVQVPIIGSLFKAVTGYRLSGPKVHIARVVYGTSETDLLADRHVYKGTSLYRCYDTKQQFLADYPHGCYSYLTPWHLSRNSIATRNKEFFVRLTKLYFRQFKPVLALGLGSFLGVLVALFAMQYIAMPEPQPVPVAKVQSIDEPEKVTALTEDEKLPDDLKSRFEGYYIAAYMESKGGLHYTIANGEEAYTLDQLRSLGYIAKPVDNCQVTLTDAIDKTDRIQLFAKNCISKKFDDPAYDISTVASLNQSKPLPRTQPVTNGYRFTLGDRNAWQPHLR